MHVGPCLDPLNMHISIESASIVFDLAQDYRMSCLATCAGERQLLEGADWSDPDCFLLQKSPNYDPIQSEADARSIFDLFDWMETYHWKR